MYSNETSRPAPTSRRGSGVTLTPLYHPPIRATPAQQQQQKYPLHPSQQSPRLAYVRTPTPPSYDPQELRSLFGFLWEGDNSNLPPNVPPAAGNDSAWETTTSVPPAVRNDSACQWETTTSSPRVSDETLPQEHSSPDMGWGRPGQGECLFDELMKEPTQYILVELMNDLLSRPPSDHRDQLLDRMLRLEIPKI
ncbi:hypothetical protein BDQ17DRAFT_1420721 [Cyathus striatus]|nr:hypothetical protein BDQ17DRAFT_1420721 [Cyathus striatus]